MSAEHRDAWEQNLPCDYAVADRGCVTVIVGGPPATHFILHKELLTHYSDFARRALQNDWIEAQTDTIALPEDNVYAFATIIDYIYTQKVRQVVTRNPDIAVMSYILADKMMIDPLRSVLMNGIKLWFRDGILDEFTSGRLSMDDIPSHTGLYRYLIDQFAWTIAYDPERYKFYKVSMIAPEHAAFFSQETDFINEIKDRARYFDRCRYEFPTSFQLLGPYNHALWPDSYNDMTPDYDGPFTVWLNNSRYKSRVSQPKRPRRK